MTSITSVNPVTSTFSNQIERPEAPKAKTSQLTNDLSSAALSTLAWSGLSLVGEAASGLLRKPSLPEYNPELIAEQLERCFSKWKESGVKGICTVGAEVENYALENFYNLNNTKIAAEFMLATTLSHVALKSLGIRHAPVLSFMAGTAITTLIENNFKCTHALISETHSIAVHTPLFGLALTLSACGIFAVLADSITYLSNRSNKGDISKTSNKQIVEVETPTLESAESVVAEVKSLEISQSAAE